MQLTSDTLKIDLSEALTRIKLFIEEYINNAGVDGIVLGLSGGIDSSVVAALCSLSIGGNRVLGLMLPERETYDPEDIDDAKFVAEKFGIQTQVCDITHALKSLYATIPVFDSKEKICNGNVKARVRMIYLYYYANKLNRIVCGSSDKSETMMGYFTKWGDAAADIAPIMDLYKTQVRKLATHLGFPDKLANKPATPALWPGQLAETELGVKYEILDLILFGLERFMTVEDIAHQLNVDLTFVKKVRNKWLSAEHKRRTPLTVKLGYRTVGIDFRLPRSGS